MVGWLVQQNDVRLRHQKLAETHPGTLSAAQFLHMLGKFFFLKSKPLKHPYNFTFIRWTALLFKFQIPAIVAFHQPFQLFPGDTAHFPLHANQFFLHGNQFFPGGKHLFINRPISFNIRILGQISQASFFCQNHISFVCLQFSHNNPEQGGFSCSVDSYNRRLFIFFNMKRSMLYDFIGAKGFADILAG